MDTRRKKSLKALGVLLAFSFAQVYVQAGLPSPATPGGAPQRFIARLTSTGGSASVNGASAVSGATVLTGATIETPAAVSATIDLGALGTVELKPKSAIQLDFSDDGNVRVKLTKGCAVIRRKASGPGEAEAYTAEGSSEKTSNKRRQLGFCIQPNGKLSAKDPRLSTKPAP